MHRKKILILGASGMAGHMIYLYLKSTGKFDLTTVVFRQKLTSDCITANVRDERQISSIINTVKPDIIINCIGVLIKGSQEYPDNAIFINAYFPHFLVKVADQISAKVIHISTDCVFSGNKGSYEETAFRDADDIYGRSKALGEIISKAHLTLRTSIIGPEIKSEGEGLFHWFMNQNGSINGYRQAFWGGITTLELAKAVEKSIDSNIFGLLHVSNGERISKYDLLNLMNHIWDRSLMILPTESKSVDKSLKKSDKFDFNIPSYEDMLRDQKNWMALHKAIYKKVYHD